MYSILANDMTNCLRFSNSVVFADDTSSTVFISGRHLKFLYDKINHDMARLTQWFYDNSLSLNVDKTNFILFKSKRKPVNYNGTVKIGNRDVKRVSHTKFLGVIVDEHLAWDKHVKHILTKLSIGIYSINMVKNQLSCNSKKLLYFANIQSHLQYALSAWGPLISACDMKKLNGTTK